MPDHLEARRAALARNAENRARLAISNGTFAASGVGFVEFEDAVEFGLAYIERPFVSIGVSFDWDQADQLEGANPPIVQGYVFDWEVNEHGMYTGAWCAAYIGSWTPPETFEFEFDIDFTFIGIAMKDVDPDIRA